MRGGPLVNTNLRTQLFENFKNKKYRDAFVQEFIFSRLPLKIRALREQLNMSQTELGERAGVAQARVSKIEDPNYGRLTLSTLLKVASAFDCGLSVDFVPFSRILNEAASLSRGSFEVPNFANDQSIGFESATPNAPNPTTNQSISSFGGFMSTIQTRAFTTDTWRAALEGKSGQLSAHLGAQAPSQQTGGLANEALGSRLS